MLPWSLIVVSVASITGMLPAAQAGFNPASGKNVAVYWGQNSFNKASGPLAQQRLSCSDTNMDIILLAFMSGISPPVINFANAGDKCTTFPGNANLLSCPQIEEDIRTCQTTNGRTIILSLGGATYNQGGWSSETAAQAAAQMVWDMFGPVPAGKTVDRPFGSAVVDGFDFDFEATTNNLPAFGQKLRSLMDAANDKKFYLTAAPQCVFPDAAVGAALDTVPFDFIMIQFFNNWCGVSNFQEGSTAQKAFNFDTWDNWAKRTSPNKNVKLLIGVPAAPGAAGGYTSGSKLKAAINWSQKYSSFGGAMMWDMSQLHANGPFLDDIVLYLAGGAGATSPSGGGATTRNNKIPGNTATTAATIPTMGTLAPQWGQCGGYGWAGPTECQPPYKCIFNGPWWSSCK